MNSNSTTCARIGGDRPDVAASLGIGEAGRGCGWSATIDLTSEPAGELRVQVVAYSRSMVRRVVVDRLYMLRSAGIVGFIDAPQDDERIIGDLLIVRGWSWSPSGVATVELDLDGTALGRARLGISRPDVRAHNPQRYGPITGWEYRGVVNSDGSKHVLSATVTDFLGRRATIGSIRAKFMPRTTVAVDREAAQRLQHRTSDALARFSASGTRPRNVFVFTHSLGLGGGQLYLQDLLRGLIPHLEQCRVISPLNGVLADELQRLGADVVIGGPGMPHDIPTYEGAAFQIATLIKASGCTCVLLNTVGQWLGADAAQRVGVPTIWAIHESFELSDWLSINLGDKAVHPYLRERLGTTLSKASRIIFEAEATRTLYLRNGVPPEITTVIPYGIDIDAIDSFVTQSDRAAMRRHHEIPADAVVLLCVGVFEERKGQAWLTTAFEHVSSAHPNAILVLVGDHPNPYAAVVHETIMLSGLGHRVRTVPITADIWHWYLMADILISASDVESMPRSMLEAMAMGRGVLGVDAWGVRELITEGTTGWLIHARDTRALAAGMHRVLSLDATAREAVCLAGRDVVRRFHRSEKYVSNYLDLIDEIENRHQAQRASHS